jgi:cytochrome c-type biogenesis protein CcmH
MTSFWLAIILLIVIALLIIWRIFATPKNAIGAENVNIRQETNVTLYHEHLAQLEHDLSEGSIEQDSFIQLKAELDKTLLQDAQLTQTSEVSQQKPSWLWPAGIAMAVVSLSFYSYMNLGAYPQLNAPLASTENDAHGDLSAEQMLAYRLQQLQLEVKNDPSNSQALFSLGQAYISVGDFDSAVEAFDGVIKQVGEHAEILGPKAQAMYYKNNQQINTDIQRVIDKALALDALDASTNILLGMDSFSKSEFANAVKYWQVVVDSGRPGLNTQVLQEAIAEATKQLSLNNKQALIADDSVESEPNLPHLNVQVSLAPQVQKALMQTEDKTVFIYAIASNGPRMPLAAVKIKASDLPINIVLDDAKAMTPQMRLSSVDKVHVYAVVSMQGSVGIKPGDFKAEALNVDVMEKSPISMEISLEVQ